MSYKSIFIYYNKMSDNKNKIIHNKNKKLNSLFYRLFPNKSNSGDVDFSKLLLTDEGIYSISNPEDSEIISICIEKVLGKNIIITDATANVGGNCINFAMKFDHVNAVEIDDINMDVLKKNISVYELNSKVKFFKSNYLSIFNSLKQDVIFIDPPWGGRSYKDIDVLDLSLNDSGGNKIYVGKIVKRLLDEGLAKMVVVKVPFNFSFSVFRKLVSNYNVFKYPINSYFILQISNITC